MKILAMDLGKSKTTACVYDSEAAERGESPRYETVRTLPPEIAALMARTSPGRVVIEIGPAAAWVADRNNGTAPTRFPSFRPNQPAHAGRSPG